MNTDKNDIEKNTEGIQHKSVPENSSANSHKSKNVFIFLLKERKHWQDYKGWKENGKNEKHQRGKII